MCAAQQSFELLEGFPVSDVQDARRSRTHLLRTSNVVSVTEELNFNFISF